jgi:hypothetical protein
MTKSLALLALLMMLGGCGPTQAEFDQSRNEAVELRQQVAAVRVELEGLQNTINEQRQQVDTLMNLGDKRLELLYQVQRLQVGRYTGGVNTDNRPGDDAVKVMFSPIDQQGSELKAAGSLTVELYDLAAPADRNLVGKCSYSVQDMSRFWYSGFATYHYSVVCPFMSPPRHEEITIRIAFTEYLTGKVFTAQTTAKVNLPPQPATAPAR